MVWKPRATVAIVIEQAQKFLLVEEEVNGKRILNQPAGHIEYGETILQAAQREALEETGWKVELQSFLGVMNKITDDPDKVFLRFNFSAKTLTHHPEAFFADEIIATHWMSYAQMQALPQDTWRSTMVLETVEHYLQRPHYSLDIINSYHYA